MEETLKELLNTLYEAEGLTDLALRRKDQEQAHLLRLVQQKCWQVSELAAQIAPATHSDEPAPVDEPAPIYEEAGNTEEAPVSEETHESQAALGIDSGTDSYDEEEKEVSIFIEEVLPQQTAVTSDQADIADASIFDDEDSDSASDEEADTEWTEEPAPAIAPAPRPTRPIMSVLSINDKFRVRKFLFGGDADKMDAAFVALEKMGDIDHARLYCYTDMGMDPEDANVKAFLSILERYYTL